MAELMTEYIFTAPTNDRLLRFNGRDEWNDCDSSSFSSSTDVSHGDFLLVFSSSAVSSAKATSTQTINFVTKHSAKTSYTDQISQVLSVWYDNTSKILTFDKLQCTCDFFVRSNSSYVWMIFQTADNVRNFIINLVTTWQHVSWGCRTINFVNQRLITIIK